jgi:hypothetical protein
MMYRTSVRSLTPDEIRSKTEQKEREEFDITIEKKYGVSMNKYDFKDDPDYADFLTLTYDFYDDDEVPPAKMPYIDDVKDEDDVDTYDQYVGAHVRVPIGDEISSGKVARRKCNMDGTARGRANVNSMLDTRTYEIDFPDGYSDEYTANVISENMYAQCDTEGRQYNLMECIIYHKTDGHAVDRADMYIKHGGNKKVRKKSRVGTCVLNGNMGQQSGSAWWISRKANQLKLLSMQLPRTCLMPLLLCGVTHMCSRSTAGSLLL